MLLLVRMKRCLYLGRMVKVSMISWCGFSCADLRTLAIESAKLNASLWQLFCTEAPPSNHTSSISSYLQSINLVSFPFNSSKPSKTRRGSSRIWTRKCVLWFCDLWLPTLDWNQTVIHSVTPIPSLLANKKFSSHPASATATFCSLLGLLENFDSLLLQLIRDFQDCSSPEDNRDALPFTGTYLVSQP